MLGPEDKTGIKMIFQLSEISKFRKDTENGAAIIQDDNVIKCPEQCHNVPKDPLGHMCQNSMKSTSPDYSLLSVLSGIIWASRSCRPQRKEG